MGRRFVLAVLGVAILISSATAAAEAQSRAGDVVPDEYIVVLRAGAGPHDVARGHGLVPRHVYGAALDGFAATIPSHRLPALLADPRVRFVEPDKVVEAFDHRPRHKPAGGSAPAQTIPTGVRRIEAHLSPTADIDGADDRRVAVNVAIIDTGVEAHPDLNVVARRNCVPGETDADLNGHGTHVGGIAGAIDNGSGVVGVAPGARLWSVKVLNRNGSGMMSWVICGVDIVTANAATIAVANMSLGCECTDAALDEAIQRSVAAGVVYTVAAGNNAKDARTFSPANHGDVIAVSAIADTNGACGGGGPNSAYGADDSLASFSNFGPAVDLAAPGVNIYSTYTGGAYATMSGTSMAAPHVAGAAALYIAKFGRVGVAAVRSGLTTNGWEPGDLCYFGGDPDGLPEPLLYANGF